MWGNIQEVRDRLGWATGSEQSYQLIITSRPQPPGYYDPYTFTLPDGRLLYFSYYGRYWSFG